MSTPEIRDLVGAVHLAKGHAFGSTDEEKYKDLIIRVCDPVFYLFFTTGRLGPAVTDYFFSTTYKDAGISWISFGVA